MLKNEKDYSLFVSKEHLKNYGQFFTPKVIAKFMTKWACKSASSMLDPAVGNSIFFLTTQFVNPACKLNGYEIDKTILNYFGNPTLAHIENSDFLLSSWDSKFDAIVCNPPYNRFQALKNRTEIISLIYEHTKIRFSGYTNLYILFLVKSIYHMSDNGKLAFIIPSEFLNSKYGNEIKQLLISKQLLTAVINLSQDDSIYENATTTNCILLLDKRPKNSAMFFNIKSLNELEEIDALELINDKIVVPYNLLSPEEKWRKYLFHEVFSTYRNLIPFSMICSASRGIATGANEFFCFSKSKAIQNDISDEYLLPCICRSSVVKSLILSNSLFNELAEQDKTVFVLNVDMNSSNSISNYIQIGLNQRIDKKYLTSCRTPWFSMEKKETAPIWVASASRGAMKFVRNTAGVKSLTTFHSIYVNPLYSDFVDIIFCYFITPVAQEILKQNKKFLGNGLDKFQPNDLNSAKILDVGIISNEDKERIKTIYKQLGKKSIESDILELNTIFKSYLEEH